MPHGELLVELQDVIKDYRGLRPLRVRQLQLHQRQSIALLGFDLAMAEVLVSLITGASLPDSGSVRVFGRATSSITSADDWVGVLDRFGLVSDRAVLVDQFTAEQNLAMPLSLELEPMPHEVRAAVRRIIDEVALPAADLDKPTAALDPASRLRLRLGRALALEPAVLLAEHPNALIPLEDAPSFAADFSRVVSARGLGAIVLTADRTFAGAVADEVLTLEPATGLLKAASGWRRWFS